MQSVKISKSSHDTKRYMKDKTKNLTWARQVHIHFDGGSCRITQSQFILVKCFFSGMFLISVQYSSLTSSSMKIGSRSPYNLSCPFFLHPEIQ